MITKFVKNIFIFLVMVVTVSCVAHKNMTYMKAEDEQLVKTLNIDSLYEYKIKAGDVLGIITSNSGVSETPIFGENMNDKQEASTEVSSQGYTVEADGNIEIPLVGKVYVEGKTLTDINTELKAILSEYLKYAYVKVYMLSFKVTVLGEVRAPGNYPVRYPTINLFEALALAGDLTEYGNRKNIKIIRKNNNQYEVIQLDVSKEKIITSYNFNLRPDDIVYVEPLKAKVIRINAPTFTLVASLLSILIVVLTIPARLN